MTSISHQPPTLSTNVQTTILTNRPTLGFSTRTQFHGKKTRKGTVIIAKMIHTVQYLHIRNRHTPPLAAQSVIYTGPLQKMLRLSKETKSCNIYNRKEQSALYELDTRKRKVLIHNAAWDFQEVNGKYGTCTGMGPLMGGKHSGVNSLECGTNVATRDPTISNTQPSGTVIGQS